MIAKFLISSGLGVCAAILAPAAAGAATERVVHRFCSEDKCADGAGPQGLLIEVNGTLYGTTAGGGTSDWGTVFSLTPDGTEKVLHSFGEDNDGKDPTGGVISVGGVLYGTTYTGGSAGTGTVFSLAPDGTYQVLYSFPTIENGIFPYAGLLELRGKLYGTTVNGGKTCVGSDFRCGAVSP